jgi:lipopolysaccharide transport system ATP-binding protein
MTTVIKIEELGKRYILNHKAQGERYTALRDVVTDSVKSFFKNDQIKKNQEEFWALRDLSFEIKQGDRVGIIGRNGAGKSTLLKILSRITEPTTGTVRLKGRVASLLEVGTGFHPELSGRENIFLNGAILGMNRSEIKKKFDEIVDFAEVEKFLDTPVKRYSSGMYVRLAFSVAAHLESEILIVDEVLAVGDAKFQKKCIGKMSQLDSSAQTIIFVSHNMQAMKQLCNKYVSLKEGQLVEIGTSDNIIRNYLRGNEHRIGEDTKSLILGLKSDEVFRLNDITFFQNSSTVFDSIENGHELVVKINFDVLKKVAGLRLYVDILDEYETILFRTFHDELSDEVPVMLEGNYLSTAIIPKNIFGPAVYTIRIQAGIYNIRDIFKLDFQVNVENSGNYNKAYPGDTFRAKLGIVIPWTTELIGDK